MVRPKSAAWRGVRANFRKRYASRMADLKKEVDNLNDAAKGSRQSTIRSTSGGDEMGAKSDTAQPDTAKSDDTKSDGTKPDDAAKSADAPRS